MATLPITVLKLAWKVLGPSVTALCIKLAQGGVESLRQTLRKKQLTRQEQAQRRADEAEAHARLASRPLDVVRYETEARVWREVAQQYAADKESLVAEIERLKRQLNEQGNQATVNMPTTPALPAPVRSRKPD
jgi:transaldolase